MIKRMAQTNLLLNRPPQASALGHRLDGTTPTFTPFFGQYPILNRTNATTNAPPQPNSTIRMLKGRLYP